MVIESGSGIRLRYYPRAGHESDNRQQATSPEAHASSSCLVFTHNQPSKQLQAKTAQAVCTTPYCTRGAPALPSVAIRAKNSLVLSSEYPG
jgi:hypothetical protein